MHLSVLPSTTRHPMRRMGESVRPRQAVVAHSKQILKQDFEDWPQRKWQSATESDARRKLWTSPSGAGARDVHTFRGVQEGRMLLGRQRTQVNIRKGV